jgi:hypothetical protein
VRVKNSRRFHDWLREPVILVISPVISPPQADVLVPARAIGRRAEGGVGFWNYSTHVGTTWRNAQEVKPSLPGRGPRLIENG